MVEFACTNANASASHSTYMTLEVLLLRRKSGPSEDEAKSGNWLVTVKTRKSPSLICLLHMGYGKATKNVCLISFSLPLEECVRAS